MLDLGHLPTPTKAVQQIFTTPSATIAPISQTDGVWETWTKPRGISMIHILCIGGGGGGGGGFTRTAGNAGGGGGGGGSSPIVTLLIPAFTLPDSLFVQVGRGGVGASGSGVAGTAGTSSVVAVYPANTIVESNILIRSTSNTVSAGGAAGTGGGGGGGGAAGGPPAASIMLANGPGLFVAYSAQAGAAGTLTTGNSVAIPSTGCISQAGAGGAGCTSADFAGGATTVLADSVYSPIRPLPSAAGSNDGSSGPAIGPPNYPLFFFGGCGGSSANNFAGGAGGNGAYGAGGGGGGAGTTGGAGGQGGSGIVYITSW